MEVLVQIALGDSTVTTIAGQILSRNINSSLLLPSAGAVGAMGRQSHLPLWVAQDRPSPAAAAARAAARTNQPQINGSYPG